MFLSTIHDSSYESSLPATFKEFSTIPFQPVFISKIFRHINSSVHSSRLLIVVERFRTLVYTD